MKLELFIEKFIEQFDDTSPEEINADTVYEELEEWSSLIALSVIAMVDEEYDVSIGAKEIIESGTVKGLFETVKAKKG